MPYIGYWQLIASVDYFVILDDVNFITRGWINRNKIIVNHSPAWLTLPLQKASQNKLINEIEIQKDDGWKNRIKKTLLSSYSRSTSFESVAELMADSLEMAQGSLSLYLSGLISIICNRLGIFASIIPTSCIFTKGDLKGQDRILDICIQLGASQYINLPGGRSLYDPCKFRREGIQLLFLEPPNTMSLNSGSHAGVTLSILDTLMHNSLADVQHNVSNFRLCE